MQSRGGRDTRKPCLAVHMLLIGQQDARLMSLSLHFSSTMDGYRQASEHLRALPGGVGVCVAIYCVNDSRKRTKSRYGFHTVMDFCVIPTKLQHQSARTTGAQERQCPREENISEMPLGSEPAKLTTRAVETDNL
eukprot:2719828-Amphidinium_carterae.1